MALFSIQNKSARTRNNSILKLNKNKTIIYSQYLKKLLQYTSHSPESLIFQPANGRLHQAVYPSTTASQCHGG